MLLDAFHSALEDREVARVLVWLSPLLLRRGQLERRQQNKPGQPLGVVPALRRDQEMRLGVRVGLPFLAIAEEGAPGGGWLHVKRVVADQRRHLAAAVNAVLAEHLSSRRLRRFELPDDIVDDALP